MTAPPVDEIKVMCRRLGWRLERQVDEWNGVSYRVVVDEDDRFLAEHVEAWPAYLIACYREGRASS